jgi:hypothetical protein
VVNRLGCATTLAATDGVLSLSLRRGDWGQIVIVLDRLARALEDTTAQMAMADAMARMTLLPGALALIGTLR